jgi:hypothetical protein
MGFTLAFKGLNIYFLDNVSITSTGTDFVLFNGAGY